MPILCIRIRLRTMLFILVPLAAVSMAVWNRYQRVKKRVGVLQWDAWVIEARFRSFKHRDDPQMLWHEFWGGDVLADAESITLADEYNDESDYLRRTPNVHEVTIFDHYRKQKHPFSLIRKHCPQLQRLAVLDWDGSETEYQSLSGISNLTSLMLNDVGVTDSQLLMMIANSPDLAYLYLVDSGKLTDEAFETIDQLKRLQTLSIENVAIGQVGASKISHLTGLRELELVGTQISTTGLTNVLQDNDETGRLHKLQKLNLNYCSLDEVHMHAIALMPSLHTLELLGCDFSDQAIELLCESKSLREIDLKGSTITDAGLHGFAMMQSLQKLQLNGTPTSQASVSRFRAACKKRNPEISISSTGDVWLHSVANGKRSSLLPAWPKLISQSGTTTTTFGFSSDYASGCVLGQVDDATLRLWVPYADTWLPHAISDDGTRLLMEDFPGFKVWKISSRAVLLERTDVDADTYAFVDNDLLIGSDSSGKGTIWNIKTGAETAFEDQKRTSKLVLSPDKKVLASFSKEAETLTVRPRPDLVATASNDTPVQQLANVGSFAFKPNGQLIVCRSALSNHSLSSEDDRLLKRISCDLPNAIVSPNGGQLLTWNKGESQIRLYDIDSGKLMWEIADRAPVEAIRFTPDGKWLIVKSEKLPQ